MVRQNAINLGQKTSSKEWAESHVPWTAGDWNKIIWTDEKRLNLDGPDGNARYWYDKEKPARTISKCHSGGGSIMVFVQAFRKIERQSLYFSTKK